MKNTTSSYDILYNNMVNRFTVLDQNIECTLGDYMRSKANIKKAESNLPVAMRSTATKSERAMATIVSFVNDKLTIKEEPAKDKTIRTFPLRASASAFLSAAVACAFVLSFCLIGARVLGLSKPVAPEVNVTEQHETETTNGTAEAVVIYE